MTVALDADDPQRQDVALTHRLLGCAMRRSTSSETWIRPSTGPSMRAKAPKVASLVTMPGHYLATWYLSTMPSQWAGWARRMLSAIFFVSASTFIT